MKLEHPVIRVVRCVFLSSNNKICWVLSHVGVGANEKADLAAKAALNLPCANLGIVYTDLKFHIDKYVMSKDGRINGRMSH